MAILSLQLWVQEAIRMVLKIVCQHNSLRPCSLLAQTHVPGQSSSALREAPAQNPARRNSPLGVSPARCTTCTCFNLRHRVWRAGSDGIEAPRLRMHTPIPRHSLALLSSRLALLAQIQTFRNLVPMKKDSSDVMELRRVDQLFLIKFVFCTY